VRDYTLRMSVTKGGETHNGSVCLTGKYPSDEEAVKAFSWEAYKLRRQRGHECDVISCTIWRGNYEVACV
jgi:hypothetical protein